MANTFDSNNQERLDFVDLIRTSLIMVDENFTEVEIVLGTDLISGIKCTEKKIEISPSSCDRLKKSPMAAVLNIAQKYNKAIESREMSRLNEISKARGTIIRNIEKLGTYTTPEEWAEICELIHQTIERT